MFNTAAVIVAKHTRKIHFEHYCGGCTTGSLHLLSHAETIVRHALSQCGSVIRSNDIHQTLRYRSNVELISGPTCGRDDSQDRRRGRLHGRCHEQHPLRIPRTQTTKSGVGDYSGSACRLRSETLIATQLQCRLRTRPQRIKRHHAVTARSPLCPIIAV